MNKPLTHSSMSDQTFPSQSRKVAKSQIYGFVHFIGRSFVLTSALTSALGSSKAKQRPPKVIWNGGSTDRHSGIFSKAPPMLLSVPN